ncbi:MAG: cyclic nucleotide-binding domain-containing protein [Bdellovibrionaceae bacterium]|nr:cyclic nucleotide-binding domain-containing protein [Pseudobdellovibrionaceae bacterium]
MLAKETYKAGDHIFFEGDIESHFYIVEEGTVQIFTTNTLKQRVDICEVEAGESFGEFALLDDQPRSATAQALTDVSLIKVTGAGYQELLEELPGWAASMLESFAHRLKNMTKVLKDSDQFIPRPKRR